MPLPLPLLSSSWRGASGALIAVAALIGGAAPLAAADAALQVAEPASTAAAHPRKTDPGHWSWGKTPIGITATGDLTWKPQDFRFLPGRTLRYIDFAEGSDDNDGASKAHPWKHHPWDPQATASAKAFAGVCTYIFKRGVTYRGELHPGESGTAAEPIQLTSDPSWGTGEAVLSGSEAVSGWSQGSDRADIPEGDHVWHADLAYLPRNVFLNANGAITRLNLARLPNWASPDPEDPKSEWWTWQQPQWWTGQLKVGYQGHRAHLGIDTDHLTQSGDTYVGAIVRTEFGIVMGTPFPSQVEGYDAERKGIYFQGIWFGDSETMTTGCRYYLEDKPQFLSAPGEFWFDRKGDGGRLYLRLPGDADPSHADVEAAQRYNVIDCAGISHLDISGLTFACTNIWWDLAQPGWGNPQVDNAAVRVLGACDDLRIRNCRFEELGKVVRIEPKDGQAIDHIVVEDNDIDMIEHAAITIVSKGGGDVQVLRNHLHEVGFRCYRQDMGHALQVQFAQTCEVAGNVLERCWGAGIWVFGGKASGETREAPLSRVLIHHNKVHQALLSANDWGSIEAWQGGPTYIYDNISADPNGMWWGAIGHEAGKSRLGYAYYLDGGYKSYLFNNIAWGGSDDWTSKYASQAAIYEATATVENSFINNTIYRFWIGSNWSPAGGRHLMLGNIWMDIGSWVFQHGRLKEDQGPVPADYPHETTAYSHNIFSQVSPTHFAVFEAKANENASPSAMATALAGHQALASDVGILTDQPVVKDAKGLDFHLAAHSPAIGQGVRLFIPWSLSRTVGEWHFRENQKDPATLLDNHWYMTPYLVFRENYYQAPVYNLQAANVADKDFSNGPLENWVKSSLTFNGVDQYASISQATLAAPYQYEVQDGPNRAKRTAQGADLATPDIGTSNLLIELYLKAKTGSNARVLVAKLSDGAGYQLALNQHGGVTFIIAGGGAKAELASGTLINDGKWHHVLAEVDRTANQGTIYVDGRSMASGAMVLPGDASLSNQGDLLVAKGPNGNAFAGSMSFLRIARSTLAESKTSIEELYDWEFDGPNARDFAGVAPIGGTRDAGAFEHAAP